MYASTASECVADSEAVEPVELVLFIRSVNNDLPGQKLKGEVIERYRKFAGTGQNKQIMAQSMVIYCITVEDNIFSMYKTTFWIKYL